MVESILAYDGMTVESLRKEHNSRPRNKLIAQVFYLAGFIETWGRGIWKVDKAFASESLPMPEYEENSGGVVVVVPRNAQIESENKTDCPEIAQRLPRDCPEIARRTYVAIVQNPAATIEELSKMIGISPRTVKNHIALLRDKFIKRIGSDTKGHWEILDVE